MYVSNQELMCLSGLGDYCNMHVKCTARTLYMYDARGKGLDTIGIFFFFFLILIFK